MHDGCQDDCMSSDYSDRHWDTSKCLESFLDSGDNVRIRCLVNIVSFSCDSPIATKTPLHPTLLCPGLFPCLIFSKAASLQHGWSPVQSIHPSTVVLLSLLKVSRLCLHSSHTMSTMLILQPTIRVAVSICDQIKGECQFMYCAGLGIFVGSAPCGFLVAFLIFVLISHAGLESSANGLSCKLNDNGPFLLWAPWTEY